MKKKYLKSKSDKKETPWLLREKHPRDFLKRNLSLLSLKVRQEQYNLFVKYLQPKINDKVIDVGASSVETLPEINFFEKKYPFLNNLSVASIDDPLDFSKKYPKIKYQRIQAGKKLPFADKSFDIAVSWATLEHVGSKEKQAYFLQELFRIGKKVFVTTPDRTCIYEPHLEIFFIHWLPRKWVNAICIILNKKYWATENTLRYLSANDVYEILPEKINTKIIKFKIFKFMPSHLLIIKK